MAEHRERPANPRIQSASRSEALKRNRVEFLQTELQTCFMFANMTETERNLKDRERAAQSLAHAEKGYATLVRFMADKKHTENLTATEYAELRAGVEQLRARLDDLGEK